MFRWACFIRETLASPVLQKSGYYIYYVNIYLRRPVDRDEAQLYQRDTRKHSGTRKCNNY